MAHTKIRRRGKYIAELREIFEEAELDVDSVMTTRSQLLADDDQTVKNSVASYTAIKVSLNYCQLGRTVKMLEKVQRKLAKKYSAVQK